MSDLTVRTAGARHCRAVLYLHGGNKRQACQALDISHHTLIHYLRHAETVDAIPVDGAGELLARVESAADQLLRLHRLTGLPVHVVRLELQAAEQRGADRQARDFRQWISERTPTDEPQSDRATNHTANPAR